MCIYRGVLFHSQPHMSFKIPMKSGPLGPLGCHLDDGFVIIIMVMIYRHAMYVPYVDGKNMIVGGKSTVEALQWPWC